MSIRPPLQILSILLVSAASVLGCPRPTAPSCVVPEPRARPAGWSCGAAGESTECYDGSPCTTDTCVVTVDPKTNVETGRCVNTVRSGDCDAGAGWHGTCRSDGACCPRTMTVDVVFTPASAPPASSVAPPR